MPSAVPIGAACGRDDRYCWAAGLSRPLDVGPLEEGRWGNHQNVVPPAPGWRWRLPFTGHHAHFPEVLIVPALAPFAHNVETSCHAECAKPLLAMFSKISTMTS
jgi:hypothetical protein